MTKRKVVYFWTQGQQAGTGPAPPLEKIVSNTPEDKARDKEAEATPKP